MAVSIRLSRGGAKKRPFYSIVAADTRAPRDGRFIEKLGIYNPMLPREHPERVVLKTERVQYWLSVGAKPTDRVARFLAPAGLADAFTPPAQSKKDKPKAKALERLREKEEARKAAEEAAAEAAAAAAEAAAQGAGDGTDATDATDAEVAAGAES